MKKIATILTVFLLFMMVSVTAHAQSCPSPDDPGLNKQKQFISSANKKHQQYRAILNSDLTREQKATCIATKGRHAVVDQLKGVDPFMSILSEIWIEEAWMNDDFLEVTYNAQGLVSGGLYTDWDDVNEVWVNESLFSLSYDGNGFNTEFLDQEWNGTDFENAFRFLSEFDNLGNELSGSIQSWYNEAWLTEGASVSTVENGLITSTINQVLSEDSTMLVNGARFSFEYDGEGRETTSLTEFWDEDMGDFTMAQRTNTEYDDMLIVETDQFTADEGMTWLDFGRSTTNFNADGLEIENIDAQADFMTGQFVDQRRMTYGYNDQDLPIENIDQVTDGMGGWVNQYANFTTYTAAGGPLVDLYQVWDTAAEWLNDYRDTYNYEGTSIATEDEAPGRRASFSLYPSPARNRVQLDVVLNQPAALQVEIFDILGRRVATLADNPAAAGTQRFNWEADQLPAGMYLVRFQVDQEIETRSIVLMK